MARQQRDERRPETFAFLGFTHYCGWTRDGRFIVKRKTQSTRLTRKLKALRQEAWRLMHAPIAEQQRRYASILRGHYAYYGLPHNWRALNGFRQNLLRIWFRCLRRRSQKGRRLGWARFNAMLERFPPAASSDHSSVGGPGGMTRVTLGKSRVRESRMPGSVRAKAEWLSYSTVTRRSGAKILHNSPERSEFWLSFSQHVGEAWSGRNRRRSRCHVAGIWTCVSWLTRSINAVVGDWASPIDWTGSPLCGDDGVELDCVARYSAKQLSC